MSAGAQPAGEPALGHYLRVLRRGWWVVLLTTLVVTGVAVALSLSQRTLYEAHADVFLSGTRDLPTDLVNTQQAQDPERAGNTQSQLARVPTVAARALREAGVRDRSPDDLLDDSSVSIPAKTDILRFTVTDESATLATRLSTAYARAYARYRREIDTAAIVTARRQIERRLNRLDPKSVQYDELSTQEQQLRTAEALQGSNVAVVRKGTEATQTQPKPLRNGVLGAMLGLLLGVGLVFVRDALNTRVRSDQEIRDRLGLPLIGRVPKHSRHLRNGNGLALLVAPHVPESEAFRMLATNLGFVNLDRGAKSIMVTSAMDGEGKSTTVANVAVALARAGNRVSLVDLDLKRPSLDRLFDLDAARFGVGVTGVALGRMTLEDALIRIPVHDQEADDSLTGAPTGTLDVLLTGALPPDSSEFVASPRVGDVIKGLAERSDLVLIDAPPILQTSDAMALAGKVDALIVVTGLAHARGPALDELRRVLDSAPVAKLGFVLTGASASAGYGYGYGHESSVNGASSTTSRKQRVVP